MDDFGKALDSLKGMLETEEGRNTLNSIVGSLTGGSGSGAAAQPDSEVQEPAALPSQTDGMPSPMNGLPLDSIGRYGELLSSIRSAGNAPRMQLLHALKPYLSSRRQQKFDVIMNLMKYSEVPSTLFGRNNKRQG